jgi:hypothetical protein
LKSISSSFACLPECFDSKIDFHTFFSVLSVLPQLTKQSETLHFVLTIFSLLFIHYPNLTDFLDPRLFQIYYTLSDAFSQLECQKSTFVILLKIAFCQDIQNFAPINSPIKNFNSMRLLLSVRNNLDKELLDFFHSFHSQSPSHLFQCYNSNILEYLLSLFSNDELADSALDILF